MKMDQGIPTGLNKRAFRVARGSGTSVKEVEEMLTQARAMSGFAKMAGGMANASKEKDWYAPLLPPPPPAPFSSLRVCSGRRNKAAQHMQQSGQRPNLEQVRAIQNSLPPDLLRKMRAAGPAGAQKIMQDYMASGGEGLDMGKMMEMMGGMGGGMPGMPAGLGNLMGGLGGMPGMGGGGGMPGEFHFAAVDGGQSAYSVCRSWKHDEDVWRRSMSRWWLMQRYGAVSEWREKGSSAGLWMADCLTCIICASYDMLRRHRASSQPDERRCFARTDTHAPRN